MQYRVKALSSAQAVELRVIDAVDELDARRQSVLEGLRVISISSMKTRGARKARVPLVVFSQQLVALLDAGLALVEAIETLVEKETHPAVRRPLERILGRLYEGQTLASALAEHPASFPPLYVATVRASERTGALSEALKRFIDYQRQIDALRKTLINASIYPLVLLAAGILVTLFLLGYVVPRFSSIYEDVGGDLPMASKLLMHWGQLIESHGAVVVLGGGALLAAAAYAATRPQTRMAVGKALARIPALGRQIFIYQLARLYRTLGMLLRGGMPAVTAMTMSAGMLSPALSASFSRATQAVREGQSLAQAMEADGLTTPVAARMLRVGEHSGNMAEMTERLASFYDEELARWVAIVTRLIEPLLMAFIGLLIGLIVVLMYFPIFQLAGTIQ